MNIDILLYILLAMTFWDFSLHLIERFGYRQKFLESKSVFSYYYPHFYNKKTKNGLIERPNGRRIYDNFWMVHWGLAFALLVAFLILK
jgi:hypothetical protein